jgi:hypothetical protein
MENAPESNNEIHKLLTKYGFYTEEYDDGSTMRTLMTGDGKSTFSDVLYPNGDVGIALAYGLGTGLNTTTDNPDGTTVTDIEAELVVRFECVDSIDAMIRTLKSIRGSFTGEDTLKVTDIDEL